MQKDQFSRIRSSMGTDYLRQYLTNLLARKMKHMMPGLVERCEELLQRIEEELPGLGYANDEDMDYDDLISKLVEKIIDKVCLTLITLGSGSSCAIDRL